MHKQRGFGPRKLNCVVFVCFMNRPDSQLVLKHSSVIIVCHLYGFSVISWCLISFPHPCRYQPAQRVTLTGAWLRKTVGSRETATDPISIGISGPENRVLYHIKLADFHSTYIYIYRPYVSLCHVSSKSVITWNGSKWSKWSKVNSVVMGLEVAHLASHVTCFRFGQGHRVISTDSWKKSPVYPYFS